MKRRVKMEAYKVALRNFAKRDEGFVFSSFVMKDCGASVEYRIGCWSDAPQFLLKRGFGLCCFEIEKQAIDFAFSEYSRDKTDCGWVVLKVECEDKIAILPQGHIWRFLHGIDVGYSRQRLVSSIDRGKFDSSGWPMGTLMFGRVKPIEVVHGPTIESAEDEVEK